MGGFLTGCFRVKSRWRVSAKTLGRGSEKRGGGRRVGYLATSSIPYAGSINIQSSLREDSVGRRIVDSGGLFSIISNLIPRGLGLCGPRQMGCFSDARRVPHRCCWRWCGCRWRRAWPSQLAGCLPPPAACTGSCCSARRCGWRLGPPQGCPGPPPAGSSGWGTRCSIIFLFVEDSDLTLYIQKEIIWKEERPGSQLWRSCLGSPLLPLCLDNSFRQTVINDTMNFCLKKRQNSGGKKDARSTNDEAAWECHDVCLQHWTMCSFLKINFLVHLNTRHDQIILLFSVHINIWNFTWTKVNIGLERKERESRK